MKTGKFLLLLIALATGLITSAQIVHLQEDNYGPDKVPLHPGVITGKLENGMKYFILPNQKPENKVELRLAVNAGSMQESEEQLGLAHFCEHMAFNGTEHFKKNELVDYLQSAGVKFGAHLNAYTSFDETVYMLSLPTEDEDLIKKGFLVLQDWAHNLLFDPEEVDKERGVVLEEYRLGLGADKRMMENYLPIVFKDSRYAERLPIGKEEILKNFDHETIKRFYRDWYRPDLMAVIVIGDIDPSKAESYICENMADIPTNNALNLKEIYPIPDHEEILVSVNSDPEAVYNQVSLYFKMKGKREVKGTVEEFKESLRYRLIFDIINERIDIRTQKGGSPISYGWVSMGEMWGARSKTAIQASALVSNEKFSESIELLYGELLRAKIHGFSEGELNRAKDRLLNAYENQVKEMDKTPSNRLSYGLVDHFLTGQPFPDPNWKLDFATMTFDETNPIELKQYLEKVEFDKNAVVLVTGSEKSRPAMPEEPSILGLIQRVLNEPVDAPEPEIQVDELMETPKQRGKVSSSKRLEAIDASEMVLSNGVRIQYKITNLKNDEILFSAQSKGGTSLYDEGTYERIRFGLDAIRETGLGSFSRTDLDKILSGKDVRLNPYISTYEESLGGSCSPDDIELLFQMINLNFSSPRSDEEAFSVYVNRQKSMMQNMMANPSMYFSMQWEDYLYSGCNRSWRLPDEKDWANTSYKDISRVQAERFSNAADFIFFFVGNIDPERLKDLAELYLGTLRTTVTRENYKDVACRAKEEGGTITIEKGTEPKSTVRMLFTGKAVYSKSDDLKIELLADALSIKLTETLREEMSGVYGSGARAGLSKIPYERYSFSISFPCGPENTNALIEATKGQITKLIEQGPENKDVQKAIEAKVKEIKERQQSNGYWLNYMELSEKLGEPAEKLMLSETEVRSITARDLKETAAKYLSSNPHVGILMPENK